MNNTKHVIGKSKIKKKNNYFIIQSFLITRFLSIVSLITFIVILCRDSVIINW